MKRLTLIGWTDVIAWNIQSYFNWEGKAVRIFVFHILWGKGKLFVYLGFQYNMLEMLIIAFLVNMGE